MTTQQNHGTHRRAYHTPGGFSRMIEDLMQTNLGDVLDSAFVATKPFVNILESDAAFEIHVAAPGMSKTDFKVEVRDGMLHITSEKKLDQPAGVEFKSKEFDFTHFHRAFRVSEKVNTNAISARYEQGILILTLPKHIKDTWNKEIHVD